MWPRPPESLTSMSHLLSMIRSTLNFNGLPQETTMTKEKVCENQLVHRYFTSYAHAICSMIFFLAAKKKISSKN